MNINRNVSTYLPPYTVVVIDATDAFYYADVLDQMEEVDILDDLNVAIDLANAYFIEKNYKWKSLEEMNDLDGGFDVRIYDKNKACVYAAHESFKEHWIGSRNKAKKQPELTKLQKLLIDALEEAKNI